MVGPQQFVERSEQMAWEPCWIVERANRDVAQLTYRRGIEMFWDTFKIVPLIKDKTLVTEMISVEAFWHTEQIIFRGKLSGVRFIPFIAADPFWLFEQPRGHLVVRCSYPELSNPSAWQRLLLRWLYPASYRVLGRTKCCS